MATEPELADMATGRARDTGPLDWVGMEGIDLPILVLGRPVNAKADAGVSLDDPTARGIHMSRLYLALNHLVDREVELGNLKALLQEFLESQTGLSSNAYLKLSGDLLLERPALISSLAGWKAYPFALHCALNDARFDARLELTIGYSSTCPCSAALARQSIQQQFERDFEQARSVSRDHILAWLGSEKGIMATPHSQRSFARISLRLVETVHKIPFNRVIDGVETALGTPLQTAVKRVDEQAFAVANGQNLMFCEDAARRIDACLREIEGVKGFRQRVTHAESLHAHDAVASAEWNWRL